MALALFLTVGLAVLDDYGVPLDESHQRWLATANLAHIRGEPDALPSGPTKFYGVAFEAPLLLAERAFGLDNMQTPVDTEGRVEDMRSIWLSRHLLTHLFFLTGGLFAYLLASRLFGNRIIALLAMLLFLLHPRLYAHSFFNPKDIPLFAMFMVALFLTHRAFRRDGPAAFALLGVGAGILLNLRIMGIVLPTAILALQALAVVLRPERGEKKRVLVSTGVFALAAALTAYVLLPYLWPDPVGRSIEYWTTLSSHPSTSTQLFMGTYYLNTDFPAAYVPVWVSITSPPFALLLGLVGAAFILATAGKSPLAALRSATPRFGLLLVGCLAMPLAAVTLFDVTVSNGWRQLYFLWAPLSLLGAYGLRWALSSLGRTRLRKPAYVGAFAGLAAVVVSMGLIHPNQQIFFNFSVDRVTPELLKTQYEMDYWRHTVRQALESFAGDASASHDGEPAVTGAARKSIEDNVSILPDDQRERISRSIGADAFHIGVAYWATPGLENRYVRVYNNVVLTLRTRLDLRAVYERVASRDPGIRSVFDVHYDKDLVAYVRDGCAWGDASLEGHFALEFVPHKIEDLHFPEDRSRGFGTHSFEFWKNGAAFDGKCVASVPAPYYSVATIRARQYAPNPGNIPWGEYMADSANVLWEGEFRADSEYQDLYERIRDEEPAARSVFNVYASDGSLAYTKEPCALSDVGRPFFLHVIPNDVSDLPEDRRRFGFANFGFSSFLMDGAIFDGRCIASVPLPEYEIAGVRTGQTAEDGTVSWSASFSLNAESYRAAYAAMAESEPLARGLFDIRLTDGDLTYLKEPCVAADAQARFFLHIVPERVSDLQSERQEAGFDNLDFDFSLRGAIFDGKCAARLPLPNYPLGSLRTGQYSGAGEVWSVEFTVAE